MATSHHNSHEYVELINLSTGESVIAEEFDDWHFDQGFRFVRYLSNSEVDFPEVYATQQEDSLERMINSSSDPMMYVDDDYSYSDSDSYYIQPMEIY